MLRNDLTLALRLARRFPLFTTLVVLTIALGIGSATAIFSVVDAVLLRPLPFADGTRLVSLWDTNPDKSIPRFGVSWPDFRDWRNRTHAFSGLALYNSAVTTMLGHGDPESVASLHVTRNFFDVLGVTPELGRSFGPEDERGEASNTVLLSYGFWRRRFGSDRKVLGSSISVDGRARTIVGVLPESAELLGPGFIGVPLDVVTVVEPSIYPNVERHAQHVFGALGRLRPGVTLAQARADLGQVQAQVVAENPEIAGWSSSLFWVSDDLSLGSRQPLLILLAASGLLLLIACINVANLLIVRGAARARETALRVALGAERRTLVRQFIIESVVLALAGGGVGVLVAGLALRGIRAMLPFGAIARAADMAIDWRVLGFTLLIALGTALAFGLVPALRSSARGSADALGISSRANTGTLRTQRLRRTLVVAEVALAVVLTVCAGLVWQSLGRMLRVDPGFRPEHVVTAQVTLGPQYSDTTGTLFFHTLLDDLQSRPGIAAAGATDTPPLTGGGIFTSIRLIGEPPRPPGQPLMSTIRAVSPGFFKAMGMRVIAGHDLEWSEAGPSMVVSDAAVKAFWPGRGIEGKEIAFNVQPKGLPVVGAVNDTRQTSLATAPGPVVYVSLRRYLRLFRTMTLVVRGTLDEAAMVGSIRRAVHQQDPGMALYNVQTLQGIVDQSTAPTRLNTLILAVFGGAALLLAGLGIFGVISYAVTQRRQELGVRLALGAAPARVLGLVLGEGALLSGAGILIGGVAALFATRLVQSWLFGIGRTDPVTFVAVALGLLLIALLASLAPALRAMRVDPLVVLTAT